MSNCNDDPLERGFHVPKYATSQECLHASRGLPYDAAAPYDPEVVSDDVGEVMTIDRNHPKYKYYREILLHALGDYGWYYGVPHAIFTQVECPEWLQQWGYKLSKGARMLRWPFRRVAERLCDWAATLTFAHAKPIDIRRGHTFHQINIAPYGPGSRAMAEADHARSRCEIYQKGFERMYGMMANDQREYIIDRVLEPDQVKAWMHILNQVHRELGRLHGLKNYD